MGGGCYGHHPSNFHCIICGTRREKTWHGEIVYLCPKCEEIGDDGLIKQPTPEYFNRMVMGSFRSEEPVYCPRCGDLMDFLDERDSEECP